MAGVYPLFTKRLKSDQSHTLKNAKETVNMKVKYNNKTLKIGVVLYLTGTTGIIAYDEDGEGEVYGQLTTNTVFPMLEGWITVDTNNYPSVDKTLIEAGIIEQEPITYVHSGFCCYPMYSLTDEVCSIALESSEL
ncbi:hypothetical protein [Mammaliicoccus sciuri]|uniref:hypothetical protein n=1 Tax=Mammaliicoccus sciuri TaxID=1296 RepID=UPI001E2D8067|nr:hypothetical protein [Mammaliicoccus sciuri]MCD8898497.1 hypothetical protein [Mammaliicoccus sciuri]